MVSGAVDGAVVTDDVEGILKDFAGVEKSEMSEPSERSGLPRDCTDELPRLWLAKDMVGDEQYYSLVVDVDELVCKA